MPGSQSEVASRSPAAWFAVLAILAAAGGASAQPRGQDDALGRARALFRAGVAEFEAGDMDAALRSFRESYDLRPHPETLYNVAGVNARLGRYRRAIAEYERYVAEVATPPAGRAAAVAAEIERLRALLARLRVEVVPDGAVVTVDGVETGPRAPDEAVLLDPGPHAVEARLAGYRGGRAEVDLAPRAVETVRLELAPLPASVVVDGLPPGARLELDGVVVVEEVVSPPSIEAAPGRHLLRAEAPGHEPAERSFEASPGAAFRIDLPLVPIVPARLRIAGGEQASVWVDGEPRGTIPWEGRLPPGDHTVAVEGPGLHRWEAPVLLRNGDRIDLEIRLGNLPSGPDAGWVWGMAGAAVAAGAVSLGLGLASLDARDEFDRIAAAIAAGDHTSDADLDRMQWNGRSTAADARNLALGCDIAWGVAAAAAVAAAILLILVDEGEEGPFAAFSSGPTTGGGVGWRW
jgi:hypothetical protein